MNYVEWLRVRNTIRTLAIVLGVLLVLGLGARIWLAAEFGSDRSIVDRIQQDPGTVTSQTTYDGRPRTVIVNASKHERVTIDDRADGGRTITVIEPKTNGDDIGDISGAEHSIGSFSVSSTTGPTTRTTVIDTNGVVPLAFYLGFAYVVGLIIATVFGATFARENNGHLEITFLRPFAREQLALSMIGADVVGIVMAEIMTIVALIIGQSFFEFPHVDLADVTPGFIAFAVVLPCAWYMFLNAASASLKRGAGAIIGFSWPVCGVIVILSHVDLHATSLGQAIHAIAWTISRIIPLTYCSINSTSDTIAAVSHDHDLLAPVLLLVIYGVLAIGQWRRVEA